MSRKMILVAAQELTGGAMIAGVTKPHTTAADREIDQAEADKLGLDEAGILKLIASGAIVQREVRVSGDSLVEDDAPVDGISAGEFIDFLQRHRIDFAPNATVDDLLALEPGPVFDGITTVQFRGFLSRIGADHDADASNEDLLTLAPRLIDEDAISRDDVAAFLDLNGVAHDGEATAEDMLQLLFDHGAAGGNGESGRSGPGDPGTAAKEIERSMSVSSIKAELGELQVPFESDANKAALALLLAQSRPAKG